MARPNGPRRAGPLWLWVLGLLAVLVAVWLILQASRGEAATVVEDDDGGATLSGGSRACVVWTVASSRVADPFGGVGETALCNAARGAGLEAGSVRQASPAPSVGLRPGSSA